MADNIALTKAGIKGTEAVDIFLVDTVIALDGLGYTSFDTAYKDGLITNSERINLIGSLNR